MDRERRGFMHFRQYPAWVRGPARIEGNEVVLDENRAEVYPIHEAQDLMFEFAVLALDQNWNFHSILTFVRRYGLLWHGARELGTGKCRESLEEWYKEADALASLLNLWMALRDLSHTGSPEARQRLDTVLNQLDPQRDLSRDGSVSWEEVASVILAEVVTKQLEGCGVGVVSSALLNAKPKGSGSFFLSHNPPNLLAAAYSDFAHAMPQATPVKECPGCGRMFFPESGKQKYHSKSCASTNRWRRWNEKQRSK